MLGHVQLMVHRWEGGVRVQTRVTLNGKDYPALGAQYGSRLDSGALRLGTKPLNLRGYSTRADNFRSQEQVELLLESHSYPRLSGWNKARHLFSG